MMSHFGSESSPSELPVDMSELGEESSSSSNSPSESYAKSATKAYRRARAQSPGNPSGDEVIGKGVPQTSGFKTALVLSLSLLVLIVIGMGMTIESDNPKENIAGGLAAVVVTCMWWVTGILPDELTCFLPKVLVPLLGLMHGSDLSKFFFNAPTFLICCGYFIGLAFERWDLHKRLAYSVCYYFGRRMDLLLFAFAMCTMFLAMVMGAGAAALCMIPVMLPFLETLPKNERMDILRARSLLLLAWSSTMGGIGTLLGTGINAVSAQIYQDLFVGDHRYVQTEKVILGSLPFSKYSICALPLSVILVVFAWGLTCSRTLWFGKESIPVDRTIFREMASTLGPWKSEQKIVSLLLLCMLVTWLTNNIWSNITVEREDEGRKEWKGLAYINNSSVALIFLFPMFLLPASAASRKEGTSDRLLDWNLMKKGFGFEVVFAYGGGYMIAEVCLFTGVARWLGSLIATVDAGEFILVLFMVLLTSYATEKSSSMACFSVLGPAIAMTAQVRGYHPVGFLLIVTYCSSFNFMMPSGGPLLAVFGTGKVPRQIMNESGLVMTIAAIGIAVLYYFMFLNPVVVGVFGDKSDFFPYVPTESPTASPSFLNNTQ